MNGIIKIFFLLFVSSFTINSLTAQSVTWNRVYGNEQPEYEEHGIQTFDGDYIIVGYRQFQGGGIFLLKLDKYGNEEW